MSEFGQILISSAQPPAKELLNPMFEASTSIASSPVADPPSIRVRAVQKANLPESSDQRHMRSDLNVP